MAERIPNARAVVLENAGHLLNIEKAEEFNRVTIEFLSGTDHAAAVDATTTVGG